MKLNSVKNTYKHNILCISDAHLPWEHVDALEFCTHLYNKYECSKVVSIGDFTESAGLNNFVKNPDGKSAKDEYSMFLEHAQVWYDTFPVVQVCTSNHDSRAYRKAFDAGIPKEFIKSYKQLMQAPKGWSWHDRVVVDNILFIHGEGYSGINAHRTAAMVNMHNTVIGHVHASAGISYIDNVYKSVWGMNVGCLLDEQSYAYLYSKHMKYKVSIGAGVILRGVPTWVPMLRDKHNRWVGE